MNRSFSIVLLALFFATSTNTEAQLVIAQGGGSGAVRTSSFGGNANYIYWGANDPSRLLAYKQIQDELGLVADQVAKLQQIRTDSYAKQREMYAEVKDVDPKKRNEFLTELRETLAENLLKKIKAVLLPHQIKRLDQLTHQFQIKGQRAYALQNSKLATAINLTDEQKKDLVAKAAEMSRTLAAEYQKLREKYQQDLLDTVLTKAQRSKLEELMGTTYEAKPFQRGNFQILTPGKGKEGASKLK